MTKGTPVQVTRRRRASAPSRLRRRRIPLVLLASGTLVLTGGGLAAANTRIFGDHQVGSQYKDGLQVSADQTIQPLGERLATKFGKFMGSDVSPDGHYLAASSTDKSVVLQIFDLKSYRLIYTVGTAPFVNQQLADTSVGQESPTWSPDGKYLWLSELTGLTRFAVNSDGTLGTATTVPLPVVKAADPLPGKPAYSADGSTLYVPVNGQNTVDALDPKTGKIEKTWRVGIAPREIAVVGKKLYVSNEGGRTALPGETTINSYGTKVPADAYLGTSTTGTVSVIDTASSAPVKSIGVGLHPTALHVAGRALFVANTNSDTVSVIDLRYDKVEQTIATQPWPSSTVGYEPDGITTTNGHLLVTLGRANAVAVFRYDRGTRRSR